jgi:hypothetical protein
MDEFFSRGREETRSKISKVTEKKGFLLEFEGDGKGSAEDYGVVWKARNGDPSICDVLLFSKL